jgi:hypothetical protein
MEPQMGGDGREAAATRDLGMAEQRPRMARLPKVGTRHAGGKISVWSPHRQGPSIDFVGPRTTQH